MSTNNQIVVKSAAWYTVSNLLVRASGFITIPVFTRLLSQAEYGQYNNFLSWVAVIGIATSMSLESTLISAKFDYADRFDDYAFSITVVSVFLAGVWWLIAGVLMPFVSPLLSLDPLYVHAMFLYLVFQPIVNIYQTHERFRYKWRATVATSIAVSIGAAVLSVALVLALEDRLFGVIAGRVLPMVIVGAMVILLYVKMGAKFLSSCVAYSLPIAAPFIPHLLSMNLLGALNKIFIERICGSEANALYSLANNCGLIISIFTTSLNGAFAPWLGDRLAEGDHESTKYFGRPYILIFALLAVGASLAAPEIMFILGGEAYMSAAGMIPAISMGCVFQFVYCMYVNIEQFKKKTVGMAVASVSAAVLNGILDVILIPQFGYESASIATAASYGWLLLMHMLLVRRLGLMDVYDTRCNVIVLSVIALSMTVMPLLYPFFFIRLLLATAMLILLLVFLPRLKRAKEE